MRLIGAPISPFVRRVAVALEFYGYKYEHVKASVVDARGTVGSFNKLVRVPSIELGGVDKVPEPQSYGCDENEAEEAVGCLVVSGSQPSVVFEL